MNDRLYQNQILFLNFHGFFGSEMIRKIVTKYCFRFVFLIILHFFQKCNLFFRNCLDFFPVLCYARKQEHLFWQNTGGFYERKNRSFGSFLSCLYKKTRYTGSFHSMRYLLALKDGQISATIYPGPYCFEVTPDDEKETKLFEYSPEGLTETVDWLNQRYDEFYREKDSILTGDESLQ